MLVATGGVCSSVYAYEETVYESVKVALTVTSGPTSTGGGPIGTDVVIIITE